MEKEESKKEITISNGMVINPPHALADISTWVSILRPGSTVIVDGTVMEILDIKGQRVRLMIKTHRDNKIHLRK